VKAPWIGYVGLRTDGRVYSIEYVPDWRCGYFAVAANVLVAD